MSTGMVKVTLIKSKYGRNPIHTLTLKALGLTRVGMTRKFKKSPAVAGMLDQVRYLLKVEEIKGSEE